MYRAKAEAVSGNKVFADGKWLQCIGNKNIYVGEFIWTDGRCVYGNHKESQQPLIITAPQVDDEAIPIITDTFDYYTLRKNIAPIIIDTQEVSDDVTSKKTDFLSINDFKGHVFICHDKKIIAANIDKAGNVYCIRVEGKNDYESKYFYETDDVEFEILKNGVVTKKITLEQWKSRLTAEFPDSSGVKDELSDEIIEGEPYFNISVDAFIENENLWYLLITFEGGKVFAHIRTIEEQIAGFNIFSPNEDMVDHLQFSDLYAYRGFYGPESLYNLITSTRPPVSFQPLEGESSYWSSHWATIRYSDGICTIYGDDNVALKAAEALGLINNYKTEEALEHYDIITHVFIQPNNEYVLHKKIVAWYAIDEYLDFFETSNFLYKPYLYTYSYPEINNVEFPLGDGHYYKIAPFAHPKLAEDNSFIITFFTPKREKITSILSGIINVRCLVAKFNAMYLFYVSSSFLSETNGEFDINQRGTFRGIYAYKNKTLQKLYEGYLINERLRPMKKYKHWEERIQELAITE